jgi:hypothetical protein
VVGTWETMLLYIFMTIYWYGLFFLFYARCLMPSTRWQIIWVTWSGHRSLDCYHSFHVDERD